MDSKIKIQIFGSVILNYIWKINFKNFLKTQTSRTNSPGTTPFDLRRVSPYGCKPFPKRKTEQLNDLPESYEEELVFNIKIKAFFGIFKVSNM